MKLHPVRTLFVAIMLIAASDAMAQSITPGDANGVVAEVQRLIREKYVFDDKKATIVSKLQAAQVSGRYALTNPRELALRLTDDLQDAARDGHLDLSWDPDGYKGLQAARQAVPPDQQEQDAFWAEEARRTNHGLEEMRILDGNVRYLRISGFHWQADRTGGAHDAAMRFLKDGDAVIIDLRGNGGGSSSAVRYAISHFMPAEPERLLMTFRDEMGKPDQSRVLSYLPAGRVTGRPLYVLVDQGAASAAEEFAYHVQQFKLGTLVGQATAGAANNNELFPVAPGFVASISVFSPRHAVSDGNWEGTGVKPDLAAAPMTALEVAHVDVLEKLVAAAKDQDRARYAWALEGARAKLKPLTLSPAALARYAGRYGDHLIRVEDGALVYQRPKRAEARLEPMGAHVFAVSNNDGIRLRFSLEGSRASAVDTLYRDGTSASHPRTR